MGWTLSFFPAQASIKDLKGLIRNSKSTAGIRRKQPSNNRRECPAPCFVMFHCSPVCVGPFPYLEDSDFPDKLNLLFRFSALILKYQYENQ